MELILVIDGGTVSVEHGALLIRRLGRDTERIPLGVGSGPRIGVQRDGEGSAALIVAEGHRMTTLLVGHRFEEAHAFSAELRRRRLAW